MKIKSKYIVDTDWLASNLEDPNLVIIEANASLPNYYEKSASKGVVVQSGRDDYLNDHIPKADFVDLLKELTGNSDDNHFLPLPSNEQFVEVMSRHGIGEDVRVVIYDRSVGMWACRFWLMLRSFGFDNAAVLDGGWTKWSAEGRPLTSTLPQVKPKKFVIKNRLEIFSTKSDVIRAMDNDRMCLINGLTPKEFAGLDTVRYGRPGHIPSSKNVPARSLVNPETFEFLDKEILENIFKRAGAFNKESVIGYCGGAVGASSGVFLMRALGIENATLYNGSLREWAGDSDLPLVVLDQIEE